MTYRLPYAGDGVVRIADGATIPPDDRNADWRDYLAWCAAGNTAEPPPMPSVALLISHLATRRWQRETGGIAVGEVTVATDDTSQRKISELRRRAEGGEINLPFGFKAVSGWVDLTLDAIRAVDMAVAAHVQQCYAAERSVAAEVSAGSVATEAEVASRFDAAMAGGG